LDVVSGEGYHIETAIHSVKAPILPGEPQASSLEESLLFFLRDAGGGIPVACAAPIAHFHKNGYRAIAHDEVNLTAPLAGVGGDKMQPPAFQPPASLVFPGISGLFG
jgi:hypothetical protein